MNMKARASASDSFLENLTRKATGGRDAVCAVFDRPEAFEATLAELAALDRRYGPPVTGRDVFCVATQNGRALAEKFNETYTGSWRNDFRPTLPALAEKILARMGITREQLQAGAGLGREELALARALIMVAARAEMIHGKAPDEAAQGEANAYHNGIHVATVLVIADYLAQAGRLDRTAHLKLLVAAAGHDIDHPGRNNPKDDPTANELHSYDVMEPLLEAYGVSAASRHDILTMLRITSPDGPLKILKSIAADLREGKTPDMQIYDPGNRFPELADLCRRPDLVVIAAILSDSDVFAGAGAGEAAAKLSSALFMREKAAAGLIPDLVFDRAHAAFLDNIVGREGFASAPARTHFNALLENLRAAIKARLNPS